MTNSKWIWNTKTPSKDSYVSFIFELSGASPRTLRLSADSNYTVTLNGRFVNSGQYPDFPWFKVYDELPLDCERPTNTVEILVWYYGKENMSYYLSAPGLRFEVLRDGQTELVSDETVLCRTENRYQNGRCKEITGQLGFGFHYDFTVKNGDFAPATVVDGPESWYPRPVKKLELLPRLAAREIKREGGRVLFDLGREEVGYLYISGACPRSTLTVSYGEHIEDGWVRRVIGSRDFSVELTVDGAFEYENCFRRLGLRYLQVDSDTPVTDLRIGVIPCAYPLSRKPVSLPPLRQRIYDTAVRTLELCMHDHYEDCPWREQGLYTMDSRNQMLCGYYAFGELAFPRACLSLIAKDRRDDGQLAICIPTSLDYVIPSFTLHYFTQVREYYDHSGDKSLLVEVLPKLGELMRSFVSRIDGGLVPSFEGDRYWNFYEWIEGLDGRPRGKTPRFEAALNCLCVIALHNLEKICAAVSAPFEFSGVADSLNVAINAAFFKDGAYVDSADTGRYSELVNSLAILCGAAGENAPSIAKRLASGDFASCTLSMKCFKYDALLQTDPAYKSFILSDIDSTYQKMLDAGATSFWETEDGASAFHNAGSLCHGWSGLPVYYYTIIED